MNFKSKYYAIIMKSFVLTLLVVINFSSIMAQEEYEQIRIYDNQFELENPRKVILSDLDNDGDLDVLTTSDYWIHWLINDGSGNFSVPDTLMYTFTSRVNEMVLADLDGDGLQDIITGSGNSGFKWIYWYKRLEGDKPTYQERELISSTAYGVTDIKVDDIDNDGDMDIAAALAGDHRVAWFENRMDNGWSWRKHEVGLGAYQVTGVDLADMDGDSDLDILYATQNINVVAWYENLGSGEFHPNFRIISEAYKNAGAITAVDFDLDGDEDFTYLSYSEDKLIINEVNPIGTQLTETIIDVGLWTNGLEVADFDGDGFQDIITYSTDNSSLVWFKNVLGKFSQENSTNIDLRTDGSNQLVLGDLNGDNWIDIVSRNRELNQLEFIEFRESSMSFLFPKDLNIQLRKPKYIEVADIDGDLDNDIAIAYTDSERTCWLENTDNTFAEKVLHYTAQIRGISHFQIADYEKDNDVDMIVSSYLDDEMRVYKNNNGEGNFWYNGDFPLHFYKSIKLANINNTGYPSLIYSYTNSAGSIQIRPYNPEQEAFYGFQNIDNSQQRYGDFATIDVDSDGDLDLVTCGSNDKEIRCFENTEGKFDTHFDIPQISGSKYLLNGDIDNDGHEDLIICNIGSIKKMHNYGDKTFSDIELVLDDLSLKRAFLKDYDNDNDLDVIALTSETEESGEVFWLENIDGNGNFGARQAMISKEHEILDFEILDFDLDGDFDIITSSLEDDAIDLYLFDRTNYNTLNGRMLYDSLGNGCVEAILPVGNVLMESIADDYQERSMTLTNGYFQHFPPDGNIESAVISQFPDYFEIKENNLTSSFEENTFYSQIEFCLEATQNVKDLELIGMPISQFRPGFKAKALFQVMNHGTTEADSEFRLYFDPESLNFEKSSSYSNLVEPGVLNIKLYDIEPFQSKKIIVEFRLEQPPTVDINEVLTLNAELIGVQDINMENDSVNLNITTVGSYDPNDINVLQGDKVLIENKDNFLDYIIRFQNTGTASAINVVVENELDENLDYNSLELLGTSHNVSLKITDKNKLSFIFDNIYLPDSTSNLEGSNGHIIYRIKPLSDISVGTFISNTADIYFDFNPPITTNTTETKYISLTSTKNSLLNTFTIFPNPAHDIVNLSNDDLITKIEVIDIEGGVVKTENVPNLNEYRLSLHDLNKGIYLIKIYSNGSNHSKMFSIY